MLAYKRLETELNRNTSLAAWPLLYEKISLDRGDKTAAFAYLCQIRVNDQYFYRWELKTFFTQ